MLGDPTEEQRSLDYHGPADGPDISVLSIMFADCLIVLDLRFGDGDLDNLNTATASAIWHSSLQGTLFQFPDVERIELRLDGSCQDYLKYFQGVGCEQLDRSGALWATR